MRRGLPKNYQNLATDLLSPAEGTAAGLPMPKISAIRRIRPEGAADGGEIVGCVARFWCNLLDFTHRRRVATHLWLRHKALKSLFYLWACFIYVCNVFYYVKCSYFIDACCHPISDAHSFSVHCIINGHPSLCQWIILCGNVLLICGAT